MKSYLIDELNEHGEFMNEEDIAKFIIQAYTGPFHRIKTKPNEKQIKKQLISEFKLTFKKTEQKEIYQQVSDNILRLHLVPFIRKYKSADICCGMFIKNFDHFAEAYASAIPVDDVGKMLSETGIMENEAIISIISRFNNSNFVPSHSDLYKEHYNPAYIIVLNDVIREYITVL
ncbi:hypothetical protein KAU15_04170 [candidate division WOR-3 bacterium]|nr:hypothetical protein [candidate division WOR-3 bacterium]